MKPVYLEDFAYPCVAYVLRRTGSAFSVEQFLTLQGEKYIAPADDLEVGDVVVWEAREGSEVTDATLTIGEHGPISTKLHLGRHFGVYEGDGLVSDTTFGEGTYFPRIRLMPLSEHPTPQKVLRIRHAVAAGEETCQK